MTEQVCRLCGHPPVVSDGWISAGHGGGPASRAVRCNRCHYLVSTDEWSDGVCYREAATHYWNKLQEQEVV